MKSATADNSRRGFVTVEIADHLFGIAIERVREVFAPERVTRVPQSEPEIAGVLNLRGGIVTAIDMRVRLGRAAGPVEQRMAIGVDKLEDAFALLVDRPGEVLEIAADAIEPTPSTVEPAWRELLEGVCRTDDGLLMILDVDRAIGSADLAEAA